MRLGMTRTDYFLRTQSSSQKCIYIHDFFSPVLLEKRQPNTTGKSMEHISSLIVRCFEGGRCLSEKYNIRPCSIKISYLGLSLLP